MFPKGNETAKVQFPIKDEPFFDDDFDDLLPAQEDIQVKVNPDDFVQFEQSSSDFECDICQETFNTPEDYDYHIYQFHHDADAAEKYYKCVECKIDFARPSELRKHISAIHQNSNKNGHKPHIKGEKSDKALNSQKSAKNKDEKAYQCDKCDKCFVTLPRLKAHVNNVHGGKSYECNKCDKVFARKGDLKKHLEHVHDGVKNYNCDR